MSTLAILALAGVVSWCLRAAFIVLLPADRTRGLASSLRYAAPAAFAAMSVTAVQGASQATAQPAWPFVAGALAAALAARLAHNLAVTVAVGAAAVAVFTAF